MVTQNVIINSLKNFLIKTALQFFYNYDFSFIKLHEWGVDFAETSFSIKIK